MKTKLNLLGVTSCIITLDESGVKVTSVERIKIAYPISAVAILKAQGKGG